MRLLREIIGVGEKSRFDKEGQPKATPIIKHLNKIYKGKHPHDTHAAMLDRHHLSDDDELKFGHRTPKGKHVWYEGKSA
jgi:hypothetical protein